MGTVSNVLNRPEPRQRGDPAAGPARHHRASASYATKRVASLRAGQSRTIAYVMLDAANPFFTDVAKGIEEVARSNGVALFICNSDSDSTREGDYVELLLQQRVRGS